MPRNTELPSTAETAPNDRIIRLKYSAGPKASAASTTSGAKNVRATVPTTHRWIPKAMTVQYLQKATTSLRATARLETLDFAAITEGTDVVVPVSVTDRNGLEVVHADITTWVSQSGAA